MIKDNVVFPVEIISNAIKNNVIFFINTDTILNKYISPYALTKSNVTEWMKMYVDNIKMIDIKFDNFYGPKDKSTKFIAAILKKLLNNEKNIDLTKGTQTIVFRHSSMYGERQFGTFDQGWISCFCQKAIETKADSKTNFTISGNGKQMRDVLYADDMIDLYITAPKPKG